ncbi:MAG: DUF2203 domain-containing protein [Acidobacteriota bacterium]
MPRYFTLEQAQAALPRAEEFLRKAMELKAALEEAEGDWRVESERIRMSGGALVQRERLVGIVKRRESAAAQLRNALALAQEPGCLVKDLDTGLLDFPTLFRGEEVYMCWKLGEPAIAFWHGAGEGFRGRKPIDRDFLENHQGAE